MMERFLHQRRLEMRALACSLALVHALIAGLGDGLHAWQHAESIGSTHAHTHSHDCGGVCVFEHTPAAQRESAVERGQETQAEAPRSGQAPHEHDCVVCQLMAQLKTAATPGAVAIESIEPVAQASVLSYAGASSRTPERLSARGPPPIP